MLGAGDCFLSLMQGRRVLLWSFVGTGARSISSLLGKKVESAPRGVAGI